MQASCSLSLSLFLRSFKIVLTLFTQLGIIYKAARNRNRKQLLFCCCCFVLVHCRWSKQPLLSLSQLFLLLFFIFLQLFSPHACDRDYDEEEESVVMFVHFSFRLLFVFVLSSPIYVRMYVNANANANHLFGGPFQLRANK